MYDGDNLASKFLRRARRDTEVSFYLILSRGQSFKD